MKELYNMNNVILKKGKEKPIRNRHHWIFSGAIEKMPKYADGDILGVESSDGELLGYAYFNSRTSISGRMLSFDETPAEKSVAENIKKAIACRKDFFDDKNTNAYRLINSEGDALPGLIADKYADTIIIQITTLGMEKLKSLVVETLKKELKPAAIYEKSNIPSRREEGMAEHEELLYGKLAEPLEIKEDGLKFLVNFTSAQKTGFFLDQREMRSLAGRLAKGKKVLNCFAYTGGFSVYAASGGAKQVDSVEISQRDLETAEKNFELNRLDTKKNKFICGNVFDFLRNEKLDYDFIILDPPAFAKRKNDIVNACRGYKEINMRAIEKIAPGGILLTSSCSYHVDEKLFGQVIFQAARDAGRRVHILGRHIMAPDHPINIYHPEGEYLKSLLLYIE
jgi:23S rRNA (cytosine1962-C5)-methyltransferase